MRYISAAVIALLVAASANAAPYGNSAHDKVLNDLNQNVGRRSMRAYSYAPAQQIAPATKVERAPAVKNNPAPATNNSTSVAPRSTRSYSYMPSRTLGARGNVSTGHLRADTKALLRF